MDYSWRRLATFPVALVIVSEANRERRAPGHLWKNRMRQSSVTIVRMLGLSLLPLVTQPVIGCDFAVKDAWVRQAPPGMTMLAAYMTLTNRSVHALDITKMTSPLFESVEAHESIEMKGMVSMRALDRVVIPSQGSLSFTPGGKHLMLIGLRQSPVTETNIPISLTDSSGCSLTVEFAIRATR